MLGFSTGALARGAFQTALSMIAPFDLKAVEISALRLSELDELVEQLPSLKLSKYEHVTLHAPSKFDRESERSLAERLKAALPYVNGIVLHAEAIIDSENWVSLGEQLLVENADGRKSTGRTVDELRSVMQNLPQARICFDLAHVHQVDPTLIEARRMLDAFGDRIAQYHLSQLDHACGHFGLTYGIVYRFQTLASLLPQAPVILESCVSADEIGRQVTLAQQCFEPNALLTSWTTAAE